MVYTCLWRMKCNFWKSWGTKANCNVYEKLLFRRLIIIAKSFQLFRYNYLLKKSPILTLNSKAMILTSANSVDNDVCCSLFDLACSSMARSASFSLADQIALSSSISNRASVSCCKTADTQWNKFKLINRNRLKKEETQSKERTVAIALPLPTPPFLPPILW